MGTVLRMPFVSSLTKVARLASLRASKSNSNEFAITLFIVSVLVGFGIIMVFSSTMASETDYLTRHLVFVAAGLGLLGLMSITPLRLLRIISAGRWFSFFIGNYYLFLWRRDQWREERWIRVGGATFQISEWAKVFLLIYLCDICLSIMKILWLIKVCF